MADVHILCELDKNEVVAVSGGDKCWCVNKWGQKIWAGNMGWSGCVYYCKDQGYTGSGSVYWEPN